MAIRQVTSSEEVKRPLGRFQPSKHQTQDYYDLHSAVELLDVKEISSIIIRLTLSWLITATCS